MNLYTWSDITSILNNGTKDPYFANGCGITVGSFDGLHLGHRVLVNTLVTECKALSIPAGAVTFTKPLPSIKHHGDYKGDISTLEERLQLLESAGVDFAIVVDFDDSFAAMTGEQFFEKLIKVCNLKIICEGVDFHCGYKGAFDKNAITEFGAAHHIKVSFTEPVYYDINGKQERISSSIIRQLIVDGNNDLVSKLLDRPYKL